MLDLVGLKASGASLPLAFKVGLSCKSYFRAVSKSLLFAVATGLTALVASSGLRAQDRPTAERPWALVGGAVYVGPTESPIIDSVVLIQCGRIAAVGSRTSVSLPQGTEMLDCSGRTITAGFWNSHVHFIQRKWADASEIPATELTGQLQDMLTRYGFTSVFDTGSTWENTRRLRDRIECGEVAGPRIRSTGEILFPKGGMPSTPVLDAVGTMRIAMPEVADAEGARTAAQSILDAGADGIKVYAVSLSYPAAALSEGVIRAAAEEAHRRGKPVFAHPQTREGLLAAVQGGADVLVHTAPNAGPWNETILALMKKSGVAVIPTLKLWRHEMRHDRASAREQFVRAGVDQLRAWSASGGEVLFGTDVGYMDDYDPTDEYVLMAEAGLSYRQILASLTTAPADRFGESARLGRIEPGLTADLVVLGQDPAKNVRAFSAVCYTIRGGRVIYKANTTQTRQQEATRGTRGSSRAARDTPREGCELDNDIRSF